jgi:hypothetical protein
MFKRGGRLATKPAAGSSATGRRGKGEQLDSIGSKLERKVANCLSCGKIFDCRNVTNDIIRFIGVYSTQMSALRVGQRVAPGCVPSIPQPGTPQHWELTEYLLIHVRRFSLHLPMAATAAACVAVKSALREKLAKVA